MKASGFIFQDDKMTDCTHDWRLAYSKQYTYNETVLTQIEGEKTIFGKQKIRKKTVPACIRHDEFYCTKCRQKESELREAPYFPQPDWFNDAIETEHKAYPPHIPSTKRWISGIPVVHGELPV